MILYRFTMVVRIQISSINLKHLELELFYFSPVTVRRRGVLPWVPKQRWLSTSLWIQGYHLGLENWSSWPWWFGGGLCSIIMLVSKDMANTYTNRKTMCLHVIERYRCSNCLPNKIIHIDPFSVQEIGLRCQFQTRPRHDCWSHSAGTCQSEDCSMSPPTLRAT